MYDGDQLTLEYDANGNVLRRYVHGTGEDDPLLWYEGAGLNDRRSLQTDAQGSIVSVANASGGALVLNTYDDYGIPGASNTGRFQYTGQAWIAELGMYYYKARIYSPTLGRFLQTDPIGYADQNNLYAYMANDPINMRDPSGKCPWCLSGGIGAAIGGLSGAIVEASTQVFVEHRSLNGLDGGRIGTATLSGVISGGISGATGGALNPITAGALEGALASASSDLISGKVPSLANMVTSALGGGLGGSIGGRITNAALGSARRTAMETGRLIPNASGRVAMPKAEGLLEATIRSGSVIGGATVGAGIGQATTNGANDIVVIGRRESPSLWTRVENFFGFR